MNTVQDLKSIQSEAILRLNCPGHGQSSGLSVDDARPLTEYRVIVVNPLSILHIFNGPPEIVRQIDVAIGDGATSYKLADDQLINNIEQQMGQRSEELMNFLEGGGLLVYYLCRPFVLMGNNMSLDNYGWLGGLVPDQPGQATLGERTVRHMSTVAHGRNIDKTEEAIKSEFSKYFDQTGLEWNTIVRTDFLSEGYAALALAGPKKCISAQLMVGNHGGQILFLPSPYSPDFDCILIDCINDWNTRNSALIPQNKAAGKKLPPLAEVIEAKIKKIDQEEAAQSKQVAPVQLKKIVSIDTPEPVMSLSKTESPVKKPEEWAKTQSPVKKFEQLPQAQSPIKKPEQLAQAQSPVKKFEQLSQSQNKKPINKLSEAYLPSKGNAVKNEAEVITWATKYLLPGIGQLSQETEAVREQIRALEKQISTNEDTIYFLDAVKVPLLTGKAGSFLESCKAILESFGWGSEQWVENENELVLNRDGKTMALMHITVSQGQPERSEMLQLIESMVHVWNKQGQELKGILVACCHCDTPIVQRKAPSFAENMIEFAKRKNICLISTVQLLYMYRDLKLKKIQAETITKAILSSDGCLPGFDI